MARLTLASSLPQAERQQLMSLQEASRGHHGGSRQGFCLRASSINTAVHQLYGMELILFLSLFIHSLKTTFSSVSY